VKPALQKLLGVGSDAVGGLESTIRRKLLSDAGSAAYELVELLQERNGFYAFESALHVYPANSFGGEIGLVEWNATDLWISEYGGLANGNLFFAEDVFGDQFCIRPDGVYYFEAETAALKQLAHDLEGWARVLLNDCEYWSGYPIAHAWQKSHGRLTVGKRLLPKIPFWSGGEYELGNLYEGPVVEAMRTRGHVACQIKDVPDGAKVRLRVVD